VLACNDFTAIDYLLARWKPPGNSDLARRAATMERKN